MGSRLRCPEEKALHQRRSDLIDALKIGYMVLNVMYTRCWVSHPQPNLHLQGKRSPAKKMNSLAKNFCWAANS